MALEREIKQKVNDFLDNQALHDLQDRVTLIVKEREELQGWADKELRIAGIAFKDDLGKGKPLDEILVPAFAVVNEASRRVFGKIPYDVQILAAIVIHQGKIAEMKAGEGKTLTETMPVYLNALSGLGVHLITTNDYLAERDAKEMGKLFSFLGLSTGFVTSQLKGDQRQKAYAADITYVTNQEIGFDYLRDNLVFTKKDRVLRGQHPLHFGIVDEIDSILIDESRTPLIIAQPVREEREYYKIFTKIAAGLEEDKDYTVDYQHKGVSLTQAGLDRVERMLGKPVFGRENPRFVFYLDVCLHAKALFERDRDYIVAEGGVEIVDEFTGRVLPGRRFTDGVHQAIEAKENVEIKESDRTVAAVTFQNFFPMYEKLAGMSGTVMEARDEFAKVYNMDVVQIPTRKPIIRADHNDLFFKTEKGKFEGLMKKVRQIHKRGQPLLIGARSVETAHRIAKLLEDAQLPFQLLTAADHRAEAEKIARGGGEGMITVATNMAGRGTDIMLEPGIAELGGLYVIGTERHESRRIDDQLVGRAGRQGDAGESQFLISMEDEIMQLFGSEKIIDAFEELDIPEDEYISGSSLDKAFRRAQEFVESKNLDSRIYLYKYDSVVNFQRTVMYQLRDRLLENHPEVMVFLRKSIEDNVRRIFNTDSAEIISRALKDIFSVDVTPDEMVHAGFSSRKQDGSHQAFNEWFNPFYRKSETGFTHDEVTDKFTTYFIRLAEKLGHDAEGLNACSNLVLDIIDEQWSNYLGLMDILKEEAGLLSYASEDPLVDFVLEGKKLYEHMEAEIQRQFVKSVFLYLSHQGMLE